MLALCKAHSLSVSQLMMANECAWRPESEVREGLLRIWAAMRECVDNGLRHEGVLPAGSTSSAAPRACTAACRSWANPT